jgi:hypothetical protein
MCGQEFAVGRAFLIAFFSAVCYTNMEILENIGRNYGYG